MKGQNSFAFQKGGMTNEQQESAEPEPERQSAAEPEQQPERQPDPEPELPLSIIKKVLCIAQDFFDYFVFKTSSRPR